MTAKTIEAAPCPFHGTLCEYVPMAHKSVEQADEIDRLRAALREHACRCEQRCVDVWEDVREHVEPTKADCRFHRARAALGEKA